MTDQSIGMVSAVVTNSDRAHLRLAIELAREGEGRVSPNPLVGAVVARGDEIIGQGFHAELGGPHAELAALADCRDRGSDPAGATLCVSLEPCAHHGRQPPCTDAILGAGLARVVIGSDDPSEKASGRGPGILRDGGVEIAFADGAEATAARLLNQAFRKHARTQRPLVMLKSAMSLDGRTATASGDSRWISGSESRALVHRWRTEVDAIAVGIGTALADDPLLTVRDLPDPPARQPLRVIFDSEARLPLDSQLVRTIGDAPLVIAASAAAPDARAAALRDAGADVLVLAGDRQQRVGAALAELGRRQVTAVMLEGGAELAGAFLDAGEIDELRLFLAPLLLGGEASRSLLFGEGAKRVEAAERALAMDWERSGDDLLIRARLREW